MREIKFRVWDGERFDFIVLDNENCGAGWKQDKQIVFQQFTGLLDKADKEIYEGDLVKKGKMTIEVTWYNAASGFNPFTYCALGHKQVNSEGCWLSCDVEIIGNIYENPNLLTK